MLKQKIDNCWKPLAFFSKKITPTERRYSTFDRELLAIYLSIKYFSHYLEGREFTVCTDHKPITKTDKSPRQFRHLELISQFTTDIRYLEGSKNIVADTLSRGDIISSIANDRFNLHSIVEAQKSDEGLKQILKRNNKCFILKKNRILLEDCDVWCETSTSANRPYVPKTLRLNVFNSLHNLSHPGIRATRKLVTAKYFWPRINVDINNWSRSCIACQKSKIARHTKSKFGEFEASKDRFQRVHIDLVGPLPRSNGFTYLLTAID